MKILRKAGLLLWHLIVFAAAVAVTAPWFLLAVFLIVGCIGFLLARFGIAPDTVNSLVAVLATIMITGFLVYMYVETKDQ